MTQKQVERIVWEWQKRLGLATWDLRINFAEPCHEEADATMTRSNTYERGELRLDKDWGKWSKPWANQIIVHELVHLLTRDIEESFKPAEPSPVVSKLQDRAVEQFVDKLAYRLVEIGGVV